MYRRPKFLEVLLEIRREMALESDYDVDLFAEMARSGASVRKPKPIHVEVNHDPPTDSSKTTELRSSRGV